MAAVVARRISAVAACVLATFVPASGASAADETRDVRWERLAAEVSGRQVTLVLAADPQEEPVALGGTIAAVRPDGLEMDVTDTSHPARFPTGAVVVPRAMLRTVQVAPRTRRWPSVVGAVAGGAAGGFAYFPRAIDDSRIDVPDSRRLAEWSAVTAASAVAGLLIGRHAARRASRPVILRLVN